MACLPDVVTVAANRYCWSGANMADQEDPSARGAISAGEISVAKETNWSL